VIAIAKRVDEHDIKDMTAVSNGLPSDFEGEYPAK